MNLQTLNTHELVQRINVLEKKNEDLERSNRNNKMWLALLTHDFKGVFANLIWVLNLYKDKTVSLETLIELIPELEENAHKNFKALSDTFLALKIQFEAAQIADVAINVKELFTEIKEVFATEFLKKELTFNFLGSEKIIITGNKFIVKSILLKIVDNAVKFSFRGGEIRFKVEKAINGRAQVAIQDFGSGIDDYTFNKLFTLDAVALRGTENEIGSGLGLVLVKEALNALNGTINLSSTKNNGTQVQIIL